MFIDDSWSEHPGSGKFILTDEQVAKTRGVVAIKTICIIPKIKSIFILFFKL